MEGHVDTLDAIQDGDGKVWASLKRLCENLGVSMQVQLRKLKTKSWAVVTEMVTTGPDGKQYTMSMIDLDSLPMWLASIDARKVKSEAFVKDGVRHNYGNRSSTKKPVVPGGCFGLANSTSSLV